MRFPAAVGHAGAWVVLVLGAAAFLLPLVLIAAAVAGESTAAYVPLPADLTGRIGSGLVLIGAVIVLDLAILLPLALVVALRAPHLRTAVTTLTLVPWLAPPIVLIVGVAVAPEQVANWFASGIFGLVPVYALWTVPFVYRVLDAGLRTSEARSGYEAALVAGSARATAIVRIVLPGIGRTLLAAALLIGATVLGEYAFAAMLRRPTLMTASVDVLTFDPRGPALLLLGITGLVLAAVTVLVRQSARRPRST